MDHGIWATWYDLLEGSNEKEYFSWLHEMYLPGLLQRPGYAWAAHYEITGGGGRMQEIHDRLQRAGDDVPTGSRYLVLVGAGSPHVFFHPNAVWNEREETGETAAMLARRVGSRVCIFSEEARVNGPEFVRSAPATTPGPAIQMGSFRTGSFDDELDLASWYAQYRLPAMSRMTGCIRTRKLVSVAGWAKHSILYEFTSLEARKEHFQNHESLALDDKVWTNRIIPLHHSRARFAERGPAHLAAGDGRGKRPGMRS